VTIKTGGLALALICVLHAADRLPQTPCAGAAVPAYPDLGLAPVIRVWDRAAWAPPACVGWQDSGPATLVVTAGRFRNSGGAEGLRRKIGAISRLAGLQYWSASRKQWQPLILSAAAVTGPDSDHPRADFSLDEVARGRTLYARQEDNIFGKAIYRLVIRAASAEHVVFTTENVSAIRYFGFTVFQPGEFRSICFLDREDGAIWRYYSLARSAGQASLLAALDSASLINRAAASYRYLAGIPADQEPPAAR
jgi:hypothetical protein